MFLFNFSTFLLMLNSFVSFSYLNNKYSKFNYGSIGRKLIKKKFNLNNLVESHHIIPKEFKNHALLKKYDFNISKSYNIMFMPTYLGQNKLNTIRPVHSDGHIPYNIYVKFYLDQIKTDQELFDFFIFLKTTLKNGNLNNKIPWK